MFESDYSRTLREIGFRCQKCKYKINGRCEKYDVWLSPDDGCHEYYEPKETEVITLKPSGAI